MPLSARPDADSTRGPDGAVSPPPLGQGLYDNLFLLLVVGMVILALVYTGWGIVALATMPRATLP